MFSITGKHINVLPVGRGGEVRRKGTADSMKVSIPPLHLEGLPMALTGCCKSLCRHLTLPAATMPVPLPGIQQTPGSPNQLLKALPGAGLLLLATESKEQPLGSPAPSLPSQGHIQPLSAREFLSGEFTEVTSRVLINQTDSLSHWEVTEWIAQKRAWTYTEKFVYRYLAFSSRLMGKYKLPLHLYNCTGTGKFSEVSAEEYQLIC